MNAKAGRGYIYTTMRLRSAAQVLLLALPSVAATFIAPTARAQGRPIDEGTFVITVAGKQAGLENFRIMRPDSSLITATGHMTEGTQQITTSLTTDAGGTPVRYDIAIRNAGVQSLKVSVNSVGGRLTATSSNQRGDESMHDYRLSPGHSVILDDGIVHQLYFLPLGKHIGTVETIAPRDSKAGRLPFSSRGLEPVQVAGRSITATHYVLGDGAARRDFWVDANGRVLRMEMPSRQLVAAREEPPK
ncbi:MAG: DUF6134 family protein [Gemmatimonadaceae bacterium]